MRARLPVARFAAVVVVTLLIAAVARSSEQAPPPERQRELAHLLQRDCGSCHGGRLTGGLGPALTESHRTLDILAEAGIRYVGDWVNDEQPYAMRVKSGSMLSMPYSIEMNDIPAFLDIGHNAESFGRMICDQFDVLYEDGAKSGRVMSICLHPFLIGHPHRSKHFAKALAHITSRQEVWITTGGAIADWYNQNYLAQ